MPFPFYWAGALVAAVFLTVVMTIFGVLLKLLNRAATEVQESIVPTIVTGIRSWSDGSRVLPGGTAWSPRAVEDDGPRIDDTPPNPDLRLEHVQRAH